MSEPRRFPTRRYVVIFVIILLLAAAPVISTLGAGAIANANGCALDEGSVHPCLIAGSDWGETLYGFGVLGWLMLATIPLGAIALGALVVVWVIHWIGWRRKLAKTD